MSPARPWNRRSFLEQGARGAALGMAAGVGAWWPAPAAADPGELLVGLIGVRTRGLELAQSLAALPGVRVAALCDVDSRILEDAGRRLSQGAAAAPASTSDARRLFDDPGLSAVVIATPDHWHAPLAVAALDAGKDVYLEAPCAHRPGELADIVAAADRSRRVVQVGLQQRSGAWFQSAVELIQRGELGLVRHARAWMTCRRRPLGRRADGPAPAGVDYAAWLGPGLARPFNSNRFHGAWSRFWDYGGGELGLWGVHWLDVAGWALAPSGPLTVHAVGERLHFVDDQETPDTLFLHYVFHGASPLHLTWEHRSWTPHAAEGRTSGIAFYGEHGTLVLDRGGWKVYDRREPLTAPGGDLDSPHVQNWVDCLRTRGAPAASLATAEFSDRLYHLGVRACREESPVHDLLPPVLAAEVRGGGAAPPVT